MPKKFGALSIFEVSLPEHIDWIGSQKTASLLGQRRERAEARHFTCFRIFRSEMGNLPRTWVAATTNGDMAIATAMTWAIDRIVNPGSMLVLPLPTETVELRETQ